MFGILVDVTRCTGCERCVEACVRENGLDPVAAEADRATSPDGLSAHRYCTLLRAPEGRSLRHACMHCLEPSCVSACLVGGLEKTSTGAVTYDPEKCIGCRYCMLACPFHVPRYEWDTTAPLMRKCTLCVDRLRRGEPPACVSACPHEVLLFGKRDELLERARERLREDPGRYLRRIWGESEFGGTSILYLSDVDLSMAGWPGPESGSIPSLTEPLIHKTPVVAAGVLAGSCLLGAIIGRRNRLMDKGAEGEMPPASGGPDGDDHA
jgi:formate dehydrogenase iron-sulfur subunit